jgi:hypothetical protein
MDVVRHMTYADYGVCNAWRNAVDCPMAGRLTHQFASRIVYALV